MNRMINLSDKKVKTHIINIFSVLKYIKKLSMLTLEEESKIKKANPK